MVALEDYLHPFKNLYRTSPQWLKNSAGWAYAKLPLRIRYGSSLHKAAAFLEQSQWWTAKELRTYQWTRLKLLLEHAYENVPYYHQTWDDAGVSPADIHSIQDMHKLPFLTKQQIKEHRHDLVAQNYRNRLLATNTGGSTGEPLEFYWERGRTRALERAFMWRQWRWAGFDYGKRTAILRGQTVNGGISHYDPIDRHLFLSGFDLGDTTAKRYLDELRNFRPVSIQAYPSTITILANYMKRNNEPPLEGLEVILAGSENLYPSQGELVEEVFQCRVYSWYGHGESVCLAGGCEQSNLYHVYSEYGYVELIDSKGEPLEWVTGVKGEIVGTGFNNWAMPLIRYRTADVAVVGPSNCSCGRNYPLWERIEGRLQEYIVGHNGKLVSLTAFIFGQHYHAFEKIERMQIIQDIPGEIVVRLKVTSDWHDADEQKLGIDMKKAIGNDWEIIFECVDDIPLTVRGKHRFVIQNIQLPYVWAGEMFQ